ncbi:MAG TPA: hypothetical protein VKM55_07955 [Candidatus Lokiarchaeia archaeon]|nr:hypothetical protein [Candidatus Lokiarchaeia archaeon]
MIRLVIFDFGDTLFHAEEDARSIATGAWVVLDRDEEGFPTVVAPPSRYGIAECTFAHVQSTLRELRRRGTWLSVASSADPDYAPFMVDAFGMGALFRHAFMAEKGDWQGDCSQKGEWVDAIIQDFNIAECIDSSLDPSEVLFVDDLSRCLKAVQDKIPSIHVVMSMPRTEEGLRYIFNVIDEINGLT